MDSLSTPCQDTGLGIKWQDKSPDTEVLTQANLSSIHNILMQTQLRWTGHVVPMPDHRLPKKLLFGELQHSKLSLGGQKKRFKDTLNVSLKAFGIRHNSWEQAAMNRPKWRASVRSGVKSHEANRIAAAEQRRQEPPSLQQQPPSPVHAPEPSEHGPS